MQCLLNARWDESEVGYKVGGLHVRQFACKVGSNQGGLQA